MLTIQTYINGNPFKFQRLRKYKYMVDQDKNVIKLDLQQIIMYVVMSLLLMSIVWVGNSINSTKEDIAIIKTKLDYVTENVNSISSVAYSSADADKDFNYVNEKLSALEKRVDKLENHK